MATPSLKYEPVSRYSTKTYIGNWFEKTCRYQKQKHHHKSIYNQDYVPKPRSKWNSDIMWDIYFKGYGRPMHLLFDHEGHKYENNFSTVYDLSYNHFVQKAKTNPVKRNWNCSGNIWTPEVDYTKNYGNITLHVIRPYKKTVWQNEKLDPRQTDKTKTEYQESYTHTFQQGSRDKSFGIPKQNSSLMNPSNIAYRVFHLRNMPLFNVTPSDELVLVPREHRPNPITWE